MKPRLIYNGRVIKLYQEKKKLPNGCLVELDIIRHPGAVLIVPFLNRDQIILLRQFRPVIDEYLYELPAGTMNPSESARACASRELMEETGFGADQLVLIGRIYPVPGYSTEKIFIYKAKRLKKASRACDDDEILQPLTVSRRAVKILFGKGQLTDAKTIAALKICQLL